MRIALVLGLGNRAGAPIALDFHGVESLHRDARVQDQRDLQYRLLRISGSRKQPGAEEGIMDTVQNYRRLALDCLKMAEAARDPATREDMTRLAHLWARLAEQAHKSASPQVDHGHAA